MRRRLSLVVVLTLSVVSLFRVPATVAIEEPDRLWTVGASAFDDKLYSTAAQALEKFVAGYPDDPRAAEAWLMLGKARLTQEQLAPALEAFRRALKFDKRPGRPQEAKFWEAETLFRLKRYAEARAAYDAVVGEDALSPFAPDAVYGRAWSELELRQLEPAVKSFREAIETWPDNALVPQATFALARTLVDLKRYAEAVPLLAAFVSKYPTHKQAADAQYLLGWTRLATGKTAEGIADLRAFVAAHPSHELAEIARRQITDAVKQSDDRSEKETEYRLLMEGKATLEGLSGAAELAGQLGWAKEQEVAWERLRREFPTHPAALRAALELARAAHGRREYAEAIELGRPAAASVDLKVDALMLTGDAQLKLKRWADALGTFEAVAAVPGLDRGVRTRALAGSAMAREEQQQWADALRLYEEIATAGGDDALKQWAREQVLALGRTRLAQGDLTLALDAFRRAKKLSPPPGRSQEATYWEAETLVRLKRPHEARAAYEAVVRADPSSPLAPDAVYGLAWLEVEQRRLEPAIRGFRQFLEKWPEHALAGDAMFALAQTLVDVKRSDDALPLLATFMSKYPNHERAGDARYLLGWADLATGRTAEGISELRDFVVSYPTHPLLPSARRKITEAVQRLGDKGELATEYQTLMSDPAPTPEALWDAGAIAAQLGQPKDQEAAWARLRQDFPDHALSQRAALTLAQAAYRREAYSDAVELAQVAAKSDDLGAEARLLIGEAQLKLKDAAAALAAFDAVKAAPGVDRDLRFRALAGSAVAQEEQRQWAEALRLYDEVAADSPDGALKQWARDALLALGKTRLAQGDLETALEAFRRARKLVPPAGRSQEARFWEAETLFRLKRYAEARTAYEGVTRGDPGSPLAPDAVDGLAWLELEQKRLEPAIRAFRQFLEKWPAHALAPDATFALARTLVDLKRYAEAAPLLATFTAKYPSHEHAADAQYLLGWARLASGKAAEGIKDLRAFVASYPTHELVPAARRKITEAVQQLGDKRELATEYQTLMSDPAPTPEALWDAGVIAAELGQPKDQEGAWKRLRKEFPEHALSQRAALALAHAAYKQEDYAQAIELARAAMQNEELRAEAYLLIGEAQLKAKQQGAALQSFQSVAAIAGVDPGLRFRALAGSAVAQEEQQQWAEAQKLYEEVAADSPDQALRQWARERVAAVKAEQKRLAQRAALVQATALLKAKKYGEAVAQARAVTETEDAVMRADALLVIGEAELKQKHQAVAVEAYEAAAAVPGVDAEIRFRALAGSGLAREEQQQWADALARYEAVANDSPDETLRRWARERVTAVGAQLKRLAQRALEQASAAFKRKRYEEALAQARAVTESADGGIRAEGLLLVGQAQLQLKRYPAALEAFAAAAAVPGTGAAVQYRALLGTAAVYEGQEQWADALKQYEEIEAGSFEAAQKRAARERAARVKARQAAPRKPADKAATKS